MKKLFAGLLIIVSLLLLISAIAINPLIYAGINGLEEFRSASGVECLWKYDTGYDKAGAGLSCNWEKWNKETNYRSIMR